MSDEVGWTTKNKQIIIDGYWQILDLYKVISFYDILDLKRVYGKYYKIYEDTEKEIDKNGHLMNTPTMKHQVDKMVTAWENIVHRTQEEVQDKVKKGMPRPISKATYAGLAFYRDDIYMQPFVDVGYATSEEINLWFNKKITIAEIIKRNKDEYNEDINCRFNKKFLMRCELSDDGSFNPQATSIVQKDLSEPIREMKEVEVTLQKQEPVSLELEEMELDFEVKDGWT
jgi:hypothetical protein